MKLLLLTLALLPSLAMAEIRKAGHYDLYVIEDQKAPVLHLNFVTTVETLDGCNRFGLSGQLRDVARNNGESLVQDFVADLAVIHTEMACPDLPKKRSIYLESPSYELRPVAGTIYARILVPQGFEPKIVP